MAKAKVFGSRSAPAPNITASGAIRRSSASARRAGPGVARSPRAAPQRSLGRGPEPAIAATFSVPAREPFSCPPPRISLSAISNASVAQDQRAAPFGPPILCAESVSASTPSAAMSTGILPAAWTASVCTSPPCPCTSRGGLGDRLKHAGLVVGGLDARPEPARRAAPSSAACEPARSTIPSAWTGCARPRRRESDGHPARRVLVAPTGAESRRLRRAPEARRQDGLFASVPPLVKMTFLAGPDQRGDLSRARFDCGTGGPAFGMDRGGIARQRQRARPSPRATSGRRGEVALWSR